MRLLLLAVVSLVPLAIAGCAREAPRAPAVAPVAPTPLPEGARTYGAPLAGTAAVPLAAVLGNPEAYAGRTLVLDGKVRASCQRKGCWMELASGLDDRAPGCRVTFKDYGFFVPVTSQGSDARVEGQVVVRTVPEGDVKHLEGEGGHFADKRSDGTAREVRVVASGVALWRAGLAPVRAN